MTSQQMAARLDDLPLSLRHWRVILAIAAVFAVVVPNVMIIAFVLARLLREWSLSPLQIGLANSLAVMGMMVGSLTGGYVADRFGRRPAILGSLIAACSFSAISALAWNLPSFVFLRMLAAAGGASVFATAPILLAEVSPRGIRGRLMIFTEVAWALGATLAALDGYLVIPALGWRVALALGCLPLLALPVFFREIFESPRFLLSRGKENAAEEITRSLEGAAGRATVFPPESSRPSIGPAPANPPSGSAFSRVWSLRFRKRTVLLWILWFVINATYFGVFTWLPSLMVARGVGEVSSFGWNVYMAAMLAPGAIIGGFLADHWGRKATLTLMLMANGAATFFFGLTATPMTFLVWGGLFAATNQAIWVVALSYTNEMYPSEMRAQGVSYAAAIGRIGSILAPYSVGSVMAGFGAETGYMVSFTLFAVILFAGGTAVWSMGVETKGRGLEELTA